MDVVLSLQTAYSHLISPPLFTRSLKRSRACIRELTNSIHAGNRNPSSPSSAEHTFRRSWTWSPANSSRSGKVDMPRCSSGTNVCHPPTRLSGLRRASATACTALPRMLPTHSLSSSGCAAAGMMFKRPSFSRISMMVDCRLPQRRSLPGSSPRSRFSKKSLAN